MVAGMVFQTSMCAALLNYQGLVAFFLWWVWCWGFLKFDYAYRRRGELSSIV